MNDATIFIIFSVKIIIFIKLIKKTYLLYFPVLGLLSCFLGELNIVRLHLLNEINFEIALIYSISSLISIHIFYKFISIDIYKDKKLPHPRKNYENFIFIIYFTLLIYINYITWFEYGWAGARVIAAKENLIISNLIFLLEGYIYFLVSNELINKKYFKFLIVVLIGGLTGSKIGLITPILIVFSFYYINIKKYPIKIINIFIICFILILIQFIIINENFELLVNFEKFLQYRGDIFEYLFVDNLRLNMYGLYSIPEFMAHHFLRLIGSAGYEAPLGTSLIALKYNLSFSEVSGGPTAPIYVYLDMFTEGSSILIILFSGISGYISAKLCNIGLIIFNRNNFISIVFGYWLMQSWQILADYSVFSYRITVPFVIFLIFILFQKMFPFFKTIYK